VEREGWKRGGERQKRQEKGNGKRKRKWWTIGSKNEVNGENHEPPLLSTFFLSYYFTLLM